MTPYKPSSTMSLQDKVRRYAGRIRRSELAARMGYNRVDEKLLARFDAVLNDELLGLDGSGFDFRYSRDAFLVALCDALHIDPALRESERARIHALVNHRNTAFRPRLFVDTGFKRCSEPIVVLGLTESKRWLGFERAFVDHDLSEQFTLASRRVVAHYRDSGGSLPIWGAIRRYLFEYAQDAVLIFDTAGHAIGETDAIRAGCATSTVDGCALAHAVPTAEALNTDPPECWDDGAHSTH